MLAEVQAVSDRIFFVPSWVRWVAFILIVILFGCAVTVFAVAIRNDKFAEWVVPALSLVQFSGIAALFLVGIFFVERGHSAPQLSSITDEFLTYDVPRHLQQIDYDMSAFQSWSKDLSRYDRLKTRTAIRISHNSGSHTAYYLLTARGCDFGLMIEANVKRFNVVIFCSVAEEHDPTALIDILDDTFSGARDAGYHVGKVTRSKNLNLPSGFPWPECIAMPLHLNKRDGCLYSVPEREHVAQDLSIMVRAFLAEAIETSLLPKA